MKTKKSALESGNEWTWDKNIHSSELFHSVASDRTRFSSLCTGTFVCFKFGINDYTNKMCSRNQLKKKEIILFLSLYLQSDKLTLPSL